MVGRGGNDPKCLLLTNGKVAKKPWVEADALVSAGKATYISRTEFKAHDSGVKVPADIKKQGDRAVKDYIKSQTSKPAEGRKARKSKEVSDEG